MTSEFSPAYVSGPRGCGLQREDLIEVEACGHVFDQMLLIGSLNLQNFRSFGANSIKEYGLSITLL